MVQAELVFILFIFISGIVGLGVNILFYQVVYKKKKRVSANTYTWLWTMGIILIVNAMLNGILLHDVEDTGFGGAIGLGLGLPFIVTPIFTIIVPGVWAAIRAIYIKATPKKERTIIVEPPKRTMEQG
jgi:hypothetical protein